ncbi:hypothetical protein ASE67_01435 [Sphingomonas sp. Leaf23]|nr:hypothetical protein ASE67_01435 [Sphingomonas sp. Leaf23]
MAIMPQFLPLIGSLRFGGFPALTILYMANGFTIVGAKVLQMRPFASEMIQSGTTPICAGGRRGFVRLLQVT